MTPLAVYEITDLCCRDESCVCAVGREDQCCTRAGTGTEDGTEGDGMMMISECNTFPRRCLPDICNINIGEGASHSTWTNSRAHRGLIVFVIWRCSQMYVRYSIEMVFSWFLVWVFFLGIRLGCTYVMS